MIAGESWFDRRMLGRQDFDRRPEQRGEALQVVDADLRQRPDHALMIPGGPGRSGVAVQPASRVWTAYRPALNMFPEGPKRRRQVDERRGDRRRPR